MASLPYDVTICLMRLALGVYFAAIFWLVLLPVSVPGADTPPLSASTETQLFSTPDESAQPIASVKKGEVLSPMAETVGAGNVRWYLVRTKSGAVGWIKRGDSDESKKLESFFESIPSEISVGRSVTLPKPPSGSLPSGTIVVPVVMTGSSVIVPVTLNGSVKTYLVLDTGATITMVSRRIASKLALRSTGQMTAMTVGGPVRRPVARLRSLKAGKAEVQNLLVSIHDFHPHPQVEGLLGLDFLGKFRMSLDSRKKVLVLSPR